MHHKPINPARRDGEELGTVEIQKGQRKDSKIVMVNESIETVYEYKMEILRSGSREHVRRQR